MTDWFDRPMRWAQLTLIENDCVGYFTHPPQNFYKPNEPKRSQ